MGTPVFDIEKARQAVPLEKLQQHAEAITVTHRADREPFPGPSADAFLNEGIIPVAPGVEVRPLVAYDFDVFRILNSPMYRQMLELEKPAEARQETSYSDEEGYELAFQFTRPAREMLRYMRAIAADRKAGRQAFADNAMETMACTLGPTVMSRVMQAISEQVRRHMKTVLDFTSDKQKEAEATFFPASDRASQAPSDGASTT